MLYWQQLRFRYRQIRDIIRTAAFITVILVMLINAFFTAGAIGMAKEATERGRTSLSDMVEYGRRKFISLLFANIIVGLIALAGLVFLIPGITYIYILHIPDIKALSAQPEFMPAMAILGLGIVIMVLYMLIISMVFALPPYAVVIDDLGAIEGVKSGFKSFMSHKLDVFLLWLVVLVMLVVSIIAGFVLLSAVPFVGWLLDIAVSLVVIQPLTVIWWSRLYLSMQG